MPKYVVRVEGNGVVIWDEDARMKRLGGFFTTRLVEAPDEQSATTEAIDLVKEEVRARGIPLDTQRPFTLVIDDIKMVDDFPDDAPRTGFVFYPDEAH